MAGRLHPSALTPVVFVAMIDHRAMSKFNIVIAEDDKNIVGLYDEAIDTCRFDRRYAGNGIEAMELYNAWHPDIMLLDIMLPVMTGYSVLKEIRTTCADTSTTIIMVTSLMRTEDIRDCMQFGIQGYILKPFKLAELANNVLLYHLQNKSSGR
jgi:DNA-binding response OmpR family regulator